MAYRTTSSSHRVALRAALARQHAARARYLAAVHDYNVAVARYNAAIVVLIEQLRRQSN